jgi:hypothetical protein
VSVTEFRLRRAQGVLASLACRKRLLQLTDTLEKALLLMRLGRRLRYGGRCVPKFPQFFDWGHDRAPRLSRKVASLRRCRQFQHRS